MMRYRTVWRFCVGGLLLFAGFQKIGNLASLQKVLLWDHVPYKYVGLATWTVILTEISVGSLLISMNRKQVIFLALMLLALYTCQLIALVTHPQAAPSCACMALLAAKVKLSNANNTMGLWRNLFIMCTGVLALKDAHRRSREKSPGGFVPGAV